jgi:hypothetical protein
VPDHVFTRRELRERRAAAERGAQQVPEAINAILNSGPILLPYLSSAPTRSVEDAMAEFDALTSDTPNVAPASSSGEERAIAPLSTWGLHGRAARKALAAERVAAEASEAQQSAVSDAAATPVTAPTAPDEADAFTSAVIESAAFAPLAANRAGVALDVGEMPVLEHPATDEAQHSAASMDAIFVEPTAAPASAHTAGHWSVPVEVDGDIDSLENSLTHTVGAAAPLVTSALILPSIPHSADITSPFSTTGEIMETGTIDLPSSLGATGVQPNHVDSSDFDVDPMDREVPSTDSAPVRAIRAVSTHTSTTGLIAPIKPQGNRTLTVLVASASVMAVGVAGLLVAGFALHIF